MPVPSCAISVTAQHTCLPVVGGSHAAVPSTTPAFNRHCCTCDKYATPGHIDVLGSSSFIWASFLVDFCRLNANKFSLGQKRVLMDAYGQPCVGMEQKMLTLHGTWLMYRGASFDSVSKVAEIKPAMMSLTPCKYKA